LKRTAGDKFADRKSLMILSDREASGLLQGLSLAIQRESIANARGI